MSMLPLLRADLFKLHKSWIMWMLWSIMLLFVIGYMLLEVLVEPSRGGFSIPQRDVDGGYDNAGPGYLPAYLLLRTDGWQRVRLRYLEESAAAASRTRWFHSQQMAHL